jgi:hypothetical protein
VVVTLDEREPRFEIRLGALDGTERPAPEAGESLRDLLAAAGEEVPPFSFEPDRLEAELEPWADALRRHAAGPLSS